MNLRLVLMVLFAASLPVVSQTPTATLSGVIQDPSAIVTPGARITARNTSTGTSRSTTADNEGRYSLTALEPGPYDVRAELTGFKTAVRTGIVLTVGGLTEVDIRLELGVVSDVVTVTQQLPLIDTSKAEVSRVVTSTSIESLPIIGRNFVDFAKLSSGGQEHF